MPRTAANTRPSPHWLWLGLVALIGCQTGLQPADATTTLKPADLADFRAKAGLLPPGEASAASGGTDAAPSAARVSGHLTISEPLARHLRAGQTVFVLARSAATHKIVAVTRFSAAHPAAWPMAFTLADERLATEPAVRLSARVDQDGDASTKQAGDLTGELARPVAVPSEGASVAIDVRLP